MISIDRRQPVLNVVMDLAVAFDTVDYNVFFSNV